MQLYQMELHSIISILFLVFFLNVALIAASHSLNRIVGGVPVGNKEYIPYQISLQILNDGKFEHHCGGSILSARHILTAAHCVVDYDPKTMLVVAGIRDLDDTKGQVSKVMSFQVHENYQMLKTADIAILYIDPPLKLDGTKVGKINLSSNEWIGGDATLLLTGWGATTIRADVYPNRLQKLIYKSITNEECKKDIEHITDAELCAREAIFSKGSCLADSGGPLVVRRGRKLFQVGIVSYGTSTCAINYPDIYARISSFYKWIMKRIA